MNSSIASLSFSYPIAEIRIHREATLNVLNGEVLTAVSECIIELSRVLASPAGFQKARVLVISTDGAKAFVAGADIKLMQNATPVAFQSYVLLGQRVMRQLELLPIPVIARTQGHTLGGGLELALACDFIAASENANFGQPEVNLGLIPGFGGSQRLAARIGRAKTKRIVFSGEILPAAKALELGVIDYLSPLANLDETISSVAATFASKSPVALAAAKRAVDRFFTPALEAGLLNEMEEFLATSLSNDAKEGLTAFVEKRPAQFSGS